jgi:hypothetical protein
MIDMKKFDVVQVITVAGALLTAVGGVLTATANERKLERKIDSRVAEALAKQNNNKPETNE